MHLSNFTALAALSLVITSVGCSSAGDEGTLVADGNLSDPSAVKDPANVPAGAAICSTLDYRHEEAAADYYRTFDTDAKVADYVTKLLATKQLAGSAGPNATLKEIVPASGHISKLVAEVFAGFQKAFPREMTGLTSPPQVAILESEVLNAFALGAGFAEQEGAPTDKTPYLFFVNTAALDKKPSDTALRGVFAHELGHLLLRTALPEIQARVRAIYMIGKAGEDGVFGAVQDDDPAIADHVENILEIQSRVGGVPDLGFPARDGLYSRIFKNYAPVFASAAFATAESQAACGIVVSTMDTLTAAQEALMPNRDAKNYVPREPTAAERANLELLTDKIHTNLRACIAPAGPGGAVSLLAFIAEIHGLPPTAVDPNDPSHAKLMKEMHPIELAVDAEMPQASLFDRLIAAETRLRKELSALKGDPAFPIDSIRVYDYEEDADDASVRVLRAIGDKPSGVADYFTLVLPEKARAQCLADIAAGKPISYGRLIDAHQPICWRIKHVTELGNALAQCPASRTNAASTSGAAPFRSGRASILDRQGSYFATTSSTVLHGLAK